MATGKRQDFSIDPHAHTWRAPKERHGTLPKQLGIAFYGAREVQPSANEGGIAFFPDGASTGGRIRLTAKNAARDIDVAWLTGEVRVNFKSDYFPMEKLASPGMIASIQGNATPFDPNTKSNQAGASAPAAG